VKLNKLGKNISEIEINISSFGIWLIVHDTEYFLSYKDYPWFKKSKVSDIYNVELIHNTHLHWSMLDVDLDLDALKNPTKYPLIYR
jgi:hypothetical protein